MTSVRVLINFYTEIEDEAPGISNLFKPPNNGRTYMKKLSKLPSISLKKRGKIIQIGLYKFMCNFTKITKDQLDINKPWAKDVIQSYMLQSNKMIK